MGELDLTQTGHEALLEQLLGGFSGLPADGVMEVVLAEDPAPLLEQFQNAQWGSFDWHPLEQGPPRWRVTLHRTKKPMAKRELREFMSFDHQRCDSLYAHMENAAQEGKLEEARALFNRFVLGMEHHFGMEEKIFFPEFEAKTGMTQGPTMVMRMEHEQMRGIIRQMREAFGAGNLSGVVKGGTTLLMVMQQHNVKEEQMLYPMAGMHMGDLDPMVRTMQRL